MTAGAVLRWAPEMGLAVCALAAAVGLTRRPRTLEAGVAAAALALLAVDAALGAAEYAGLGGAPVAAGHAAATALFKSAGLAAAFAAVGADALHRRTPRPTAWLVVLAAAALALSLVTSLLPPLILAHLAVAGLRPGRRLGAVAAALALVATAASQLALASGDGRLAALHLGLAAWAGALRLQFRGELLPVGRRRSTVTSFG